MLYELQLVMMFVFFFCSLISHSKRRQGIVKFYAYIIKASESDALLITFEQNNYIQWTKSLKKMRATSVHNQFLPRE